MCNWEFVYWFPFNFKFFFGISGNSSRVLTGGYISRRATGPPETTMFTQVPSTHSMPRKTIRKRKGLRLSRRKGQGKSASVPRGKTSADPPQPAAADGVPADMADAPARAQAVPAPPAPAPAEVAPDGMANAPKPPGAAPPLAAMGGRAVGNSPRHASASSSEEEDDDDSDADAGPPARAKRLRMAMATQKVAFYKAQDKFLQYQRDLLKECPGTKPEKLMLRALYPRPKSAPMTPAQKLENMKAQMARETQLHGDNFGPGYYAAGAAYANGGGGSNGMGATVSRG